MSEVLRRLYQPLYLPVLALIVCFLTLTAKDSFNYNMFKLKVFITSTFILVISEISLNFSTPIIKQNFLFFLIPIILSIFAILIYLRKLKFLKTT